MARTEKDIWDKIDIGAKVFGILVAAVLAVRGANFWKDENQAAAQSAAYTNLAKIIATAPALKDSEGSPFSEKSQALNDWVSGTLANPTSPPKLEGEALENVEELVASGALTRQSTEQFVESMIRPYLDGQVSDGSVFPLPAPNSNDMNGTTQQLPFPSEQGPD